MSKNTIRISAAILGVAITTGLVAVATNAYQGQGFRGQKNEAAKEAIETGDYNAFVQAVGENSPIADKLNEETFSKMLEAHEAMEAGNYEEAKAIKEELGFKGFGQGGMGHHKGMKGERMNEEARTALDSGDYVAWLAAIEDDAKILDIVDSEAKFLKLVEAHELMEQAREIKEELGFPMRGGGMNK